MPTSRALVVAPLVLACGCIGLGPVDPPPGPIQGSYKPLSDIEPRIALGAATTPGDSDASPSLYKITKPGSYYLTGNIQVATGVVAIEIAADDVTVDLAGFTVSRDGSGASSVSLIQRVNAPENTSVVNGIVRNSGRHGIDLAANARVERVRVIDAAENGITVAGVRGVVESCLVDTCGLIGITVGSDSHVAGCVVYSPGTDGISVSTNCRVTDCRVNNATGNGITSAYGSVVQDCQVRGSGQYGISSSLIDLCTEKGMPDDVRTA